MADMQALPRALYTAEQVRELDRRAIEDRGVPGYELMTRAGHATLDALRRVWPAARSLAVLCGPGNNGGDGFVVARVAKAQGMRVLTATSRDPDKLRGDARRAFEDFIAAGGRCHAWSPDMLDVDVVVDALFGTGLAREPSDLAAQMIRAANGCGRPVVAVDIPSGLHSDSGQVLGVAVLASLTVTFIGRKLGLYLGQAPDHVGHIAFDDLGVPPEIFASLAPAGRLLGEPDVAAALPRRRRTAHKGDHGHVLVIGGGAGMPGAARLAGEAALRSGAGLVTLAVHPDSVGVVAARPELMCVGIRGAEDLAGPLSRATMLAIGPGLGRGEWSRRVLAVALDARIPAVVDADALTLLADSRRSRDDWVLTPHPGEAARLVGSTSARVQSHRLAAVHSLQAMYGGHVVLKGAGSIVQSPDQVPCLCDRGNPGMATGGMGDVLTGVIAGIAAQCGDLGRAARAGVYVHAQAGDLAARRGERGLLAGDVLDQVRSCVNPTSN
jgi:hydroxyethylthiazole kinase-like uncharacterized protein yjeF